MTTNRKIWFRIFEFPMLLWAFVAVLSGCQGEPIPVIVQGGARNDIVRLPPRPVPAPVAPPTGNIPAGWVPAGRSERKWTAIVVHHSATDSGNSAIFDRQHRQDRYWDGVGYDFVIGNGTGSDDGEVEVTFRWQQQRTGAHCKTPDNWANEEAVGICLVGNFNNSSPTRRQMQSLAKLITFLQERYDIPASRIYGHNSTPGARVTDCPGRNFSLSRLKAMLGS